MSWSIEINLPLNRDYKGTLKVYSNGSVVHSCECLGRGSNGPENNYDHTNWYINGGNGDTPTGSYNGTLVGVGSPTSSYGPYKRISLAPYGGHALEAGRSGIMIHGGDPATSGTWKPLNPTHGCIRVSNANQKIIADLVASIGGKGFVAVYGDQKERP